jgi:hypothetical protein
VQDTLVSMNVNLLIDSVVRQTTVLIAQLATVEGGRPSLAHTANQVFVDLVRELKDQGVGSKVIADMFGLALRTYHDRVRRLTESATYGGRSLWEVLLEFIQDRGTVLQAEVLGRFKNDDPLTVRGALKDLVDSGMVFRTGRGAGVTFRAASREEMELPGMTDAAAAARSNLVWVAVNRLGPAPESAILEMVPMPAEQLRTALASLLAEGKIRQDGSTAGDTSPLFLAQGCFIPKGTSGGWEAAVFDHYQAVVTAISTKLRLGANAATAEHVGGSTYSYFVWPGHPLEQEVYGLLRRLRGEAAGLRQKVDAVNAGLQKKREEMTRVIAYVGQTVVDAEGEGEQ